MSLVHQNTNFMSAEITRFRAIIEDKLLKSGEKQRLIDSLKLSLQDSDWEQQLKLDINKLLKTKSVDEIITELSEKSRESVGEQVKSDLVARIKVFLKEQEGV